MTDAAAENSKKYTVLLSGNDNGELAGNVPAGLLTSSKIKTIENKCNVTIAVDNNAHTVTITPESGTHYAQIAYRVLTRDFARENTQDLTVRKLKNLLETYISAQRPRPGKPAPVAAPEKPFQAAARKPASTPSFTVSDFENPAVSSFVQLLSKQNRAKVLEIFEKDPRIGIKIELARENDAPDGEAIGFKVHMPVYSDGSSGWAKWQIAQEVFSAAANEKAISQAKLDQDFMTGVLNKKLAEIEDAKKPSPVKETPPAAKTLPENSVIVTQLNGRSLANFATYLLNGRSNFWRAFTEKKDLGFTIKAETNDKLGPHFILTFPKSTDGQFNEIALNLAKLCIGKMRTVQERGQAINLEFTRKFLDEFIEEQKAKSKTQLGDNITMVFAELAKSDRIAVLAQNTDKADAPVAARTGVQGVPIASAVQMPVSGGFTCPVDFPLPRFDNDGRLKHTQRDGSEKIFQPTPNQLKLIEAIRNPDVKTVLCQAPTGAGKTFWSTYVALELLQLGLVAELGYERPTTTVGDHYNPYLKGDMNEKFGPFSDVIRNVFAEHLGAGDVKKGLGIVQKLEEAEVLTRYDQLYKAGDSLKFKLVIADEAQNKDRSEIFHLITRPAEGGKMVLIGDGEDQDYLKKRKSGFLQALNIFGNEKLQEAAIRRLGANGVDITPNSVAIVRLGAEDIKRDPHTAYVYEIYKAFDRAAEVEATAKKKTAVQPAPGPAPGK